MAGEVSVQSEEGQGTKFIITQQVKTKDRVLITDQVNHNTMLGAYNFTSDFGKKFKVVHSGLYKFVNKDIECMQGNKIIAEIRKQLIKKQEKGKLSIVCSNSIKGLFQ